MNDEIVLCGASSYNKKYYFNEQFSSLPQGIQDELHIMCVLFTADVGGVLQDTSDISRKEHTHNVQHRQRRMISSMMRLVAF